MKNRINKILNVIGELKQLPKVDIGFEINSREALNVFKYFTKPHPRYFIFKNKSIGVALININLFKNSEAYLQSVNGKNSAFYFSRKAQRAGYSFKEINPNEFIDEIFEINNSVKERQGKAMDESYKKKITNYPLTSNFRYFGVFHEKKLVAYNWISIFGEVAIISRLLGHGDFLKDGIMYLLMTSTICELIKSKSQIKFVMYDTMFGASDGLKMFKERLGFKPFRVKWKKI